jgi:hypothetical protein
MIDVGQQRGELDAQRRDTPEEFIAKKKKGTIALSLFD